MENKASRLDFSLSTRDSGIKSYVCRAGRMTEMQKDALKNLYPKHGIDWDPLQKLNSQTLFNKQVPLIIEVGFGMGDATLSIAVNKKENCFVALDVHAPGVGKVLSEIENKNLSNLKVMRHDAVEVIEKMVCDNSIDGYHIFFPDPWPKKKHHKRRLMNAYFVNLLAKSLKKDAYIYFVTDWEEYAEETLSIMQNESLLQNTANPWAEKKEWRPITKFEKRAITEGRAIKELFFVKR